METDYVRCYRTPMLLLLVATHNVAAMFRDTTDTTTLTYDELYRDSYVCPIGFKLAQPKFQNNPMCYRIKGPETFDEKFSDCAGNLFTLNLYDSFYLTKPNITFWTDSKSLYSGGPYVDWSYTKSMGDQFGIYDVHYNRQPISPPHYMSFNPDVGEIVAQNDGAIDTKVEVNVHYGEYLDLDKKLLCLCENPATGFKARPCDEKLYRYCFLEAHTRNENMDRDGCEDLQEFNYWRYWSPKPTCLSLVTPTNGINDGVTWHQAQKLCAERKGQLLSTGWRYANYPFFQYNSSTSFPLGISADNETLKFYNENVTIPPSDWHFENKFSLKTNSATSLGALRNEFWFMVDSFYLFYNVICERPIQLRPISMNLTAPGEGLLILETNETVNENEIYCFTDSNWLNLDKVNITSNPTHNTYFLEPKGDGYYWCIHVDTRNHMVSESSKVIFVEKEESLNNTYAVKLQLKIQNRFAIYRSFDVVVNDEIRNNTDVILKLLKKKNIIRQVKIKRQYIDGKTILVHVLMHPIRNPQQQVSTWDEFIVESIKPVYYCPAFRAVVNAPIGTSITVNCQTHNCIGDFNEGVEWRTRPAKVCNTTTEDREQLDQVFNILEELVENTAPVMISDIEKAFNQVDSLLNTTESLEIPGYFLLLLDQLGLKVDLNGSRKAAIVRDNIAMLLVDSSAEHPVRGLTVAATTDNSIFSEDGFEIISGQVNSTHIMSNKSEIVVYLPETIANEQRRISFLVFRNSRAFQETPGVFVNSRILSIKMEYFTEFGHEQVIHIHFRPLQENLERNQRRACAYWHFLENGTGFWSQEGCTFIRSTAEGVLDLCRCDHLTHFAQVLISRNHFSQRHEDALEILSIMGCFLSIFGLLMIGITAVLFRSWRQDYNNKIWLQLCVAILLLVICFLVIVFEKFDHYNIPCMLVGVLLHYSVLASFCWMLVAAVLSYLRLVIVFARDASHKLLRVAAFSWGVPCVIVGILLAVAPQPYAGLFEEKHSNVAFCYPSGLGLWLTVHAPVALILVTNWTLFGLILRSVFAPRKIQTHGDPKASLRRAAVSCLLVFLFGLPWIFGLSAHNIISAYIFALTATFQGFVLFLFFVLGNKKTRDLWLNKLQVKRIGQTPTVTSTNTDRNAEDHNKPRDLCLNKLQVIQTGQTPTVTSTNTDRSAEDHNKPRLLKLTPPNTRNTKRPKKKRYAPIEEQMKEVILELEERQRLTNNEILD